MSTQMQSRDGRSISVPVGGRTDIPSHPGSQPDKRRRLRVGWAISAVAAGSLTVLWAVIAGLWLPRGPLTSSEALASLLVSLLVGTGAGLMSRSRWAILGAPVLFVLVFEAARVGTDGPTVDGLHLSSYGLIALVVGRGFHGLVSLVPMMLGAAAGAGLARRRDASSSVGAGRHARRAIAIVTSLGLAALAVGLARPASTAPILDDDGNEIAESIAELTTVDVRGHDLALMIRGHSVDNPVLLFLAGGPGGTELGAMRNHLPELEEHVTVVTWDQRGAGRSYSALDPTDTLTLDGAVADAITVTNYLRDRFDQDQIYLAGQSWGTTLGVLAVQDQPELFRAFIGTGQMVSQRDTDRIFYEDTLEWARATADDRLIAELESLGRPPYAEMFPYETALAYEQQVYAYDHSPNAEGDGQMSENLIVQEYALIDQIHALGAFMDTFAVLYPQLQEIDFRESATEFDIPMFFVQGAHEARGRADLFDEWYPMIDAPIKDLVVLDTSGHRPLWEQPDEFVDYVVQTVLTQTTETVR